MASKFDLAVITAVIVGGLVWIESRHRVVIEPSSRTDFAASPAATVCPDKENEPYSAKCLAFMGGERVFSIASQANAAAFTLANASPETPASAAACPDNDNVPYSESCLRFLSGRYWRPNLAGSTIAPGNAPK